MSMPDDLVDDDRPGVLDAEVPLGRPSRSRRRRRTPATAPPVRATVEPVQRTGSEQDAARRPTRPSPARTGRSRRSRTRQGHRAARDRGCVMCGSECRHGLVHARACVVRTRSYVRVNRQADVGHPRAREAIVQRPSVADQPGQPTEPDGHQREQGRAGRKRGTSDVRSPPCRSATTSMPVAILPSVWPRVPVKRTK